MNVCGVEYLSGRVCLYIQTISRMEHVKWVDDERSPNCCSPIYAKETASALVVQRPLWQDVLWGRERGHGRLPGLATSTESKDTSHYVDIEFDSGCGSDDF